jgi:hypothetical protein
VDGSTGTGGTVGAVEAATCDSCGATGEDLAAVRRVYVTPEDWDREGKAEVVDEVERWCFPCRTHYPHQEAEG